MKQKLALVLSLALAFALTACSASTQPQTSAEPDPAKSAPTQSAVSSCKAEAPETSQATDGQDVTDAYRDVLPGTYVDEYGDQYTIRQDGTLTCEATNGETDEGTWWVWEEGSKEYLSIYIQNTAHPTSYTFETTEEGGISLFDDTTGELSNLFTPTK